MDKLSSGSWIMMYPDGSMGRRDRGGWACLLEYKGQRRLIAGPVSYVDGVMPTSPRMELTAVVKGLQACKGPRLISIYTDSQYVQRGWTEWLPKWRENNWRVRNNKPVANQDLWQELILACAAHESVMFNWIPGHSGNTYNELADKYAGRAAVAGVDFDLRNGNIR